MAQAPATTADVQRILDQLTEQQKVIQALQTQLADQQRRLDQIQGVTAAAPAATTPKPAVIAAAAPAPAPAPAPGVAQGAPAASTPKVAAVKAIPAAPRWYEKYTIRGYVQLRHDGIVNTNRNLTCDQCDRYIGNGNNFGFRRARLILSGDVSDRITLYFQTDFASVVGTALHMGQIRDLYADVFLDKKKEFRVRLGQSKVPFGFENLQSSQNRLSLDRSDPINSAVANERDLGAFFYWAPAKIRTRLATLATAGPAGLKGTGDYGVIGMGVYNGQTANRPEANNSLHYVARAAYPWQLKNGQYIEAGIQGYTGRYTVTGDQRSLTTKGPAGFTFADQRLAGSVIVYPQPFGFQAEYNVGKGPQYNPRTQTIETKALRGGYAQTMFMKKYKGQVFTPFYRFQYYSGGKKQELDARSYLMREHELGLEWQQNSFFEISGHYAYSDRRYEDAGKPNNRQKGSLVRLQFQVNY
ncbi:MAG: porin [Acidobacteriota bacterium]